MIPQPLFKQNGDVCLGAILLVDLESLSQYWSLTASSQPIIRRGVTRGRLETLIGFIRRQQCLRTPKYSEIILHCDVQSRGTHSISDIYCPAADMQ